MVKIRLHAQAFEPEPGLVPPLQGTEYKTIDNYRVKQFRYLFSFVASASDVVLSRSPELELPLASRLVSSAELDPGFGSLMVANDPSFEARGLSGPGSQRRTPRAAASGCPCKDQPAMTK